MRYFRSIKGLPRLAAVIAMLAVLVQGMVPLAASAQPAEGSLEAALNVICSASGTKTLNHQIPTDTRPGDSCPLCPTFSASAIAPSATEMPVPVNLAENAVFSAFTEVITAHASNTQVLPRAPPHRIV